MIAMRSVLGLLAIVWAALAVPAFAQDAPRTLVGTWILTIDGEAETRTLVVSEEAPNDGGALLAAKYGITGKGRAAVEARIVRSDGVRRLHLVTPADAVIVADELADGSLAGTFTTKNGKVRPLVGARAGAAVAAVAVAAAEPPPECAAFRGAWAGSWNLGNSAEIVLRVVEVKPAADGCTARLSYSRANPPPAARDQAEIKGGVLAFLCNRSTGGTCRFKVDGAALQASYMNSMGDTNAGLFKRVGD